METDGRGQHPQMHLRVPIPGGHWWELCAWSKEAGDSG